MLDFTYERRLELATRDARNEGFEDGMSQGKITQLVELVQEGLLMLNDAAKKAGMTEAEFKKYMTPRA